MTQAADIWRSHLKPGERIVWQASVSEAARKADAGRDRWSLTIVASVAAAIALLGVYRFYETAFLGAPQPNAPPAVAAAVFLALAVLFAGLSIFLFRKLGRDEAPDPAHYAVTNLRLLALDDKGRLVDEIAGADIEGAIFDDDRRPAELHVMRRGDDESANSFFIGHVESLPAVKTMIEKTFAKD